MATEEQEIDWIYFELNDRKLRMDRYDSNNLQIWKVKQANHMLKTPYWRSLNLCDNGYGRLQCHFDKKHHRLHRIVYYAHNPDWNIHDNSHYNVIDHIDQNPTNNHISNLRVATNAQNMQNRNAKGCHYYKDKKHKKWLAKIVVNKKQTYLGQFDTEEEAHEAYLKAKREHHPFFHES